jgi:hypothetical protein
MLTPVFTIAQVYFYLRCMGYPFTPEEIARYEALC